MLHIAFHELPRGRAQDVLASQVWRGVHESHDILQLVSEPVSAARLIKGRAAPDSAAESLIKQPAVDQKVRGKLGCFHFDRAQEPVPPLAGFLECSLDVGGIAKTGNEFTRFFFVVRLPEEKSHFGGVPRFNLDHALARRHKGRRPAPTSPVNRSCSIATGSRSERLRPMNPARSAVNEAGVGAEVAKVMQSQNSGL